ncbi:restriction endonuclease subunit S [Microbulbifer magnicolonia]|uniref:restriction endonuclease subunit S n=1 Tax=Microbulbifer magnicolonia TaxID=3109744 RepID=UPI002B4014EC|nr:restriction endonuclease subunit S [Microbulbifer sp. GG15]
MSSAAEFHWDEMIPLDDLVVSGNVKLGRGNVISKIDIRNNPGPFPIYSSSSKNEGKMGEYGEYMFDEEMISWSVDGGGYFFYRPKHKFSVTNVSGYMRLSADWDYRFTAYSLQFQHEYFSFDYQTKAHPSVIREFYLFPKVPIFEQQKIAKILTSVDKVIEKTRAQIDKLKDLKTGMMQELLTNGIGHTNFKPIPKWTTGKIPDLQTMPASWELVNLTSVAKLESGHTPSRDNSAYWDGAIPWLSLHDTKNLANPILSKTVYSVTQEGIDNSSARVLPTGTVAFSRTASVGNCVILGKEMATSQDFANYICGDRINNRFLLQLFRWMQHVWSALSEGSTHKTIYMPVFKKLQILLPPIDEQITIAEMADRIDQNIKAKGDKLQSLIDIKKALMQDLLTGKVRVKVEEKEPVVA